MDANSLFEDYVYHSLLYYGMDQPEISDYEFDDLCKRLKAVWSQVTHPQRSLTDESALEAGTGFQMTGKWPHWAIQRARDKGYQHWLLEPGAQAHSEPEIFRPMFSKRYLTIVGSRDAPQDVLDETMLVAQRQVDRGVCIRSGGADGMDTAGEVGARRSRRIREVGIEIYLPYNGMRLRDDSRRYEDIPNGVYNALKFENWEDAREIALKARGSWNGLSDGGIKLHVRNAYQPLGRDLKTKSQNLLCWAIPIGKKGMVKGGTNTAVQIAINYGIPVINLYKDEDRRRIQDWLAKT